VSELKRIVIVGGGTAGWLSAAYLNRVLQHQRRQAVEIVVIASEEVGVIGVGEATVPTLAQTLRALDIPEWQFLAECDATFKNAIRFRNWRHGPQGDGDDSYYHCFDAPLPFEGTGPIAHWLRLVEAGEAVRPFAGMSVQTTLCDRNLSPKTLASGDYEAPVPYAYHMDAVKFGRFLKKVATGRGVVAIDDHITDVALDETGNIAAVRTRTHGEVAGHLFIDCSGFHGLLIEKALGEPWVPYGDVLLCDRAVALPVPYLEPQPAPRCYTTSTALSAGWAWEIDLQARRGTGYVYSSAHLSEAEAEAELRAFVGAAADGVEARHLKMRIGRRQRSWVKNCLAIGLSAGFVEPLESTGIYLIEMGLQLFLDHFALGEPRPMVAQGYNEAMAELFEQIRDFIVLHYCLSEREDTPFWQAVTREDYLPERVLEQLDAWAQKPVSLTDLRKNPLLFLGPINYFCILAGLGYLPDPGDGDALVDLDSARRCRDFLEQAHRRAGEMAPPHKMVLDKLTGAAVARTA
jgi:hypothetical protein